jgi:hypothetical protein
MCLRDLDNLSIPRGGGAGGRLQAWIRTRPAPADPTSIATVHDAVIAHMAIALRLITLAFAPAPEVGIKPACAALRREWWARLRPVFSVSDPRGQALATEKSANENRHRDDVWRALCGTDGSNPVPSSREGLMKSGKVALYRAKNSGPQSI